MTIRPLLIGVSLAANLALAVVVATPSVHWSAFLGFGSGHSATADSAGPNASATSSGTKVAPLDSKLWSGLLGSDLAGTLARLRAAGFPLSVQRAILGALVAEQFADRHKAIAAMISAVPWWRGNLYGSANGAKIIAERQKLQRDEKEVLDNLLGVDSGVSAFARAEQIKQFGNLPPEKLGELSRITSDYNELMSEVRNAANGILLPEDRDKLAYLEKEKRADIVAALTPDELLEYDMRNSPVANTLRYRLSAFNPTDDEFRTIFKMTQAASAQYADGNYELMTPEQRQAYGRIEGDVMKQLESVLPPERFAELKQKADPAYIQANALATRLDLPATAAADIVAVQKDIMKRAGTIRQDATLTPDSRATQLRALGDEAVVRLTPTLGDAGVAAYRQSGGAWINGLQRSSATPAPKR